MSDLIDREAVIDAIADTSVNGESLGYGLAEEIVSEIPPVENKAEWIPVSERLPKIADVYRVTRYYPNNVMNPNYLVDACFFDGSDTWYNDNRINHERAYADNVIAWNENPEPYIPESEDT